MSTPNIQPPRSGIRGLEGGCMNKSDTNASVANDVLQSDHHVHMSEEEIAKARAHHEKKHGGENPQGAANQQQGKKIPVKPR
jgi:hypothetical protein